MMKVKNVDVDDDKVTMNFDAYSFLSSCFNYLVMQGVVS